MNDSIESNEPRKKRRVPHYIWWIGMVVGVLVVGAFASLVIRNALATRQSDLGIVNGRLRPCPASPNCVCTQDADVEHKIEPLKFSGTPAEAIARLRSVIAEMPRTKIVSEEGNYLHVEFTTRLMRYVDDVEFAVDPHDNAIHFRSASRIGYSDLGTNRRRMEAVRTAFSRRP